jgi:hypothetical protein
VLLAIRSVRNRERRAAKEDLDTVSHMLADERRLRIQSEERNYGLLITLAEHGIKPPEPERGDDGVDQKDL